MLISSGDTLTGTPQNNVAISEVRGKQVKCCLKKHFGGGGIQSTTGFKANVAGGSLWGMASSHCSQKLYRRDAMLRPKSNQIGS